MDVEATCQSHYCLFSLPGNAKEAGRIDRHGLQNLGLNASDVQGNCRAEVPAHSYAEADSKAKHKGK